MMLLEISLQEEEKNHSLEIKISKITDPSICRELLFAINKILKQKSKGFIGILNDAEDLCDYIQVDFQECTNEKSQKTHENEREYNKWVTECKAKCTKWLIQ